ncbi:MAG: GAF domain-containing protein [Actinomycetes bacterium]
MGSGRTEMIRHLVVAIDRHEDLTSLAFGAATAVAEIMAAASAHITLIEGDNFRDLVNVGHLDAAQVTFPVDQIYPLESYPAAAERLSSHRGYLSSDALEVVTEYLAHQPLTSASSFLGAPIVAQGRVFGELFLCRQPGEPEFTSEDLELAMDLGTVLGARIPAVVEMEQEA